MNIDSEFRMRAEQRFDYEVPRGAAVKPAIKPLKRGEVVDVRIAPPVQQALIRLSSAAATRPEALRLLDHVKQGRIASIICMNSSAAITRTRRLGATPATAIRTGEDAVVLLDPNDLRQGTPMIAFRQELDPFCGPPKPPRAAQPAKLDAALRRALAGFEAWRAGIQLGRSAKCALAPLDDPRQTVPASGLGALTAHPNVLPRLLCAAGVVTNLGGTPIQVRHRHQPRACNTTFVFQNDGGIIDLLPSNMNPRFILPDDTISRSFPLQTKLTKLLVDEFPTFLAATDGTARLADRVRVALVDLTGRRLCQPQFAGFGESLPMPGASTAKILLVYAAFQLILDLRRLVSVNGIRDRIGLEAQTKAEWPNFKCPPVISFFCTFDLAGLLLTVGSPAFDKLLTDVTKAPGNTPRANELLLLLGFEYVASVAWQSGLRHPQRGGIWFGGAYCQGGSPTGFTAKCHTLVDKDPQCPGEKRAVWTADPLGVKSVQGTALAYATYMTLLAQGRLVDAGSSAAIQLLLSVACSEVGQVLPVRATKCGDTSRLLHDAAWVEHEGRRWAVGIMSQGLSATERPRIRELARKLHLLIKGNGTP